MPAKQKKKKAHAKKLQKGSIGSFFVFGVLALLMVLGIIAVGGLPPASYPQSGQHVIVITPTPSSNHDTLQLKTFGYITIAPTPTPGKYSLCNNGGVNNEPGIIEGYSPQTGQSVGQNGQIKVWVNDEGPPLIAPGETTNADGSINNTGNQGATAPDGYLWEPALYVDQPAEQNGTPIFPTYIKGQFSNTAPRIGQKYTGPGAAAEPLPAGTKPTSCLGSFRAYCYTAEYIWNVSKLGLSSGTHQAEFLIHDGDLDRGVGCIQITIQ